MRVLYDHQIFQMQKFGGISRYFTELILNTDYTKIDYKISLLFNSNEYLRNKALKKSTSHFTIKYNKRYYRYINFINKYFSNINLKLANYDIFHPTFYEDYYINNFNKPYVITVYDLINEKYPEYFLNNEAFINKKRRVIKNAKRIISISENTKKDIIDYYNVEESRIDVTYLAESLSNIQSIQADNLPKKYLLYVGKRGGYKNFERFYKGINKILVSEQDLYLVCAGGGDFNYLEKQMFNENNTTHKIKYISFNCDAKLKFLYENAIAFIFPSLYEGFGIPVLESFASGCLTCLSNTSSLKEIGGKGALYFDPYSYDDIKSCVQHALTLDKSNQYTNEGFNELTKYSWKQTLNETHDTYKKCLE